MLDAIKTFLNKTLTSRKFWAAMAAGMPFALAHDWENFAYVWMAYAGIQGVVDATGTLSKWETGKPDEDPDPENDPG